VACAALALSGTIALTPLASAQESTPAAGTPVASPVTTQQQDITTTSLFSYDFTEFPEAPLTIRLLRITLEPGASVPLHTHPGPEFDLVESGVLTAGSDGDAVVSQSGSTENETLASTERDLTSGEWILYPEGVGMTLTNNGDENAVILSAVFLPVGDNAPESITYTDGQPSNDDFTGVSFTVLADGLLTTLPSGAATVSVDQLDIPAGTDLPASDDPVAYSLIEGDANIVVDSGDVQVSRTANPGLQPSALPNQTYTLGTGDAAFFPAGIAATSRENQGDALSVYRVSITPETALSATPAEITFTEGSDATPTPTATAETTPEASPTATPATTDGIPADTVVTTNTAGVNMRTDASVDADIINELNEGISLVILEGPVEADDYEWYRVQLEGQPEADWSIGWVASDFFDAPETETSANATPTANGTPAATETPAAAGDFAEGDIVVTTEENVRLREEASTDGEPIDAYPLGTELIITGEPVEADDYTWYPVQLSGSDSITGWVVADFIAAADGE